MKKTAFSVLKRAAALSLAVIMMLCFTSCRKKVDGKAFTFILSGNVNSLDPQTATNPSETIVIGSIFEGLCRVSEESEAVPGVAERWDHNKDYTRFTFHLRKAFWSNEERVTADDFVFGITRALTPETGASSLDDVFIIKNARAFYNGEAEERDLGIKAKDDKTVVIELERSFPDFPMLTAGNHYMPCNREFFENESLGHYGLDVSYTITNGPFTFSSYYAWDTDYNERSISLVQSVDYRGERKTVAGYLDYLIDYKDSIDNDPLAALKEGEMDIIRMTEQDARNAEENGCGILALRDGVYGLLFNRECDALTYATVREVLTKAVDRDALLESGGFSEEATGIMPRSVLWNGKSYYRNDEPHYILPDENISETVPEICGMLDLDKIPSITILCSDDENSIAAANSILISWNNKLGNAFNIMPLPESELNARVSAGNYEAALYTLRGGGSTPFHVLSAFSSDASPKLFDSAGFDETLSTLDFTYESFRSAEDMLMTSYIFYPIASDVTYYALSPGASGITVSPDRRVDFSQAKKP